MLGECGIPRGVLPTENEPICLISFEITAILLNGRPDTRPGFWKAYRRELELNEKTNYANYHTHLCQHQLASLKIDRSVPTYFRNGQLTIGKDAGNSMGRGDHLELPAKFKAPVKNILPLVPA